MLPARATPALAISARPGFRRIQIQLASVRARARAAVSSQWHSRIPGVAGVRRAAVLVHCDREVPGTVFRSDDASSKVHHCRPSAWHMLQSILHTNMATYSSARVSSCDVPMSEARAWQLPHLGQTLLAAASAAKCLSICCTHR